MKKVGILGTTALAGLLLVPQVVSNDAQAASEVNETNAVNMIKAVQDNYGDNTELLNYGEPQDKGDYYEVTANNKSGIGSGSARIYKDGTVERRGGMSDYEEIGQYPLDEATQEAPAQNPQPEQPNNNDAAMANVNASNNQQSPEQEQAMLPETGENSQSMIAMFDGMLLILSGLGITLKRRAHNK
ncbi:LPXTG cell wall anchor domain-containing protein [Staphylococcus sp. 11261D007BR]